jgi:hypothetical protein
MRARVNVYALGTNHGPASLASATISDPDEIGFAQYANEPGEIYFTLPWNSSANSRLLPLQTHVEIQRWSESSGNAWTTLGWGLLDDYDASDRDTVWYGSDYLSLFDGSLTAIDASYSTTIHSIINAEALAAIRQSGTTAISPNSRLGFITIGNIGTTSTTAALKSAYQGRLSFMRTACQVLQAGTSTRPIMSISTPSWSAPNFTFDFYANKGTDQLAINLEYGALANGYRVRGGYGSVATHIKAIGQKLDGANIMYSSQTSLAAATYGIIESPRVFTALPDQTALDNLTVTEAKRMAQINRDLALSIRSSTLPPLQGWAIGDSVPVTIKRGPVSIDHALYTIWGYEWIGHRNGSETTRLILQPQMT